MKSIVIQAYGGPEVLHITETPKPKINDNEVLVKVRAFAVTSADSRIRGARFPKGFGFLAKLAFGITKPRVHVLGSTYSGVVEQVGRNVAEFVPGDEVCGMTGIKMGTYAEYIVAKKQASIAKKPASVSHTDAAGLLFGGTAALYFIRDKLQVKNTDTILVNGASGAVGTNAVQLAHYYGADVTAVTTTKHHKLVQGLGATHVIDYQKQDITTMGKQYEVVLDTVGNITLAQALNLITPTGRAGLMVAGLGDTLRARGRVKTGTATEKKQDITFLLDLVAQNKLQVVIDACYKFDEIVKAHEHVDTGQKVGNIVVNVD
jgi:NADPH:quinone reductase-like Zn-dependent oxidoreductase